MRTLGTCLIVVLSLWFVWGVAAAQERANVTGAVEDPTGAVVLSAKVTLTDKATGATRETVVDAGGNFAFRGVPHGEYSLRAEAEGFETAERNLTVGAEPLKPVRLQLDIIITTDDVTVVDSRDEKLLTPENNADQVDFDDDLIRDLPTDSRNILPVLNNFLSQAAMGTEGLTVMVDGVEDTQLTVPAGSIRRVVINKNPYSAEYRRPGKARVEVITKDGSRRHFDGEFAYYVRNSSFDARNPVAIAKNRLKQQLVEFNFGGPVIDWRDLTFFVSTEYFTNEEAVIVDAFTQTGRFIENVPTFKDEFSLSLRADTRGGDRHRQNYRYEYNYESQRNRGVGGFALRERGITLKETGHKIQFSNRSILSPSLLNEFRAVYERENENFGERASAPSVRVRGAFEGGPSPVFQTEQETTFEFQNITTLTHGRHTFRFGGGFRPRWISGTDATNFNGTFEFLSLSAFRDQSPFKYTVNQGDPDISFSRQEAYGFFQDEVKLRRNLQLTLGIRYDWQSNVKDGNNFAPRIAVAYSPFRRTVIRSGFGLFYERLSEKATRRALLLDGTRNRELIVFVPSFTDPLGGGIRQRIPPSIFRVADDLVSPYVMQASASIEQTFARRTSLTLEYLHLRGVHLFRSRNINAPVDFTGRRPDRAFFNIDQVESSASLKSDAFISTFQWRAGKAFKGLAQYTYSKTFDDTDGLFGLPVNNYDLRPEWGRSNFDVRQRFNLVAKAELPFFIHLAAIFTYASGVPYNITTGFDDNGDLVANDRPPGFTRNTGLGPDIAQLDFRFTKKFKLPRPIKQREGKSERKYQNVEFNIDFFNALNRSNFINYVGEQSSPFFGVANEARAGRTIQLSLKYEF